MFVVDDAAMSVASSSGSPSFSASVLLDSGADNDRW
jgi:hypothetical protein